MKKISLFCSILYCLVGAATLSAQLSCPICCCFSGFTAQIDPEVSAVCGDSTIWIVATPSGGTSPYTFNWDTGETIDSINPTIVSDTTYTVTVTDNAGCSIVLVSEIDHIELPTPVEYITCEHPGAVPVGFPACGNVGDETTPCNLDLDDIYGTPNCATCWAGTNVTNDEILLDGLSPGSYAVTYTDPTATCMEVYTFTVLSQVPYGTQFVCDDDGTINLSGASYFNFDVSDYSIIGETGCSTGTPPPITAFNTATTPPGSYVYSLARLNTPARSDPCLTCQTYIEVYLDSIPTIVTQYNPDLICDNDAVLTYQLDLALTTPGGDWYAGDYMDNCAPGIAPLPDATVDYGIDLFEGYNIYTYVVQGQGDCSCATDTVSLYKTCDPALHSPGDYVIYELQDLCDDNQVCFRVDIDHCYGPPGFTTLLTWNTTPSVANGVETEYPGNIFEICYSDTEIANAGATAGDQIDVDFDLDISHPNVPGASCSSNGLDDYAYIVPCCGCDPLQIDVNDFVGVGSYNNVFIESLSIGCCAGCSDGSNCCFNGFDNIWGQDGAVNENDRVILDDGIPCGLPGGLSEVTLQDMVDAAEAQIQLDFPDATLTLSGTVVTLTPGVCGALKDFQIDAKQREMTGGCAETSTNNADIFIEDTSCCP